MMTAQLARQEEWGSGAALVTDCPTVPKSKALGAGVGEGGSPSRRREGVWPGEGTRLCWTSSWKKRSLNKSPAG